MSAGGDHERGEKRLGEAQGPGRVEIFGVYPVLLDQRRSDAEVDEHLGQARDHRGHRNQAEVIGRQ